MTGRKRPTALGIGEVIALISLPIVSFSAGYHVGRGSSAPTTPTTNNNIILYISEAGNCRPAVGSQICLPVRERLRELDLFSPW